MEWAKAWKSKGPAPQKLGFIYMLNGDNGTSNTDPYATEKTPDNNWIKTGPHVMIVGAEAKSMMHITTIGLDLANRFTALMPPERSSPADGYAAQKSSRFSENKNPAWLAWRPARRRS